MFDFETWTLCPVQGEYYGRVIAFENHYYLLCRTTYSKIEVV